MVRYLLLFAQPVQRDKDAFSRWRKEVFATRPEVSPYIYLDAATGDTQPERFNHLNIYFIHSDDDDSLVCNRIDQHLQLQASNGYPMAYLWQLHDEIVQVRKSSLSSVTVVTVGMKIPDSPEADLELNQWYDLEHLPGLATVPGWLAGFRTKLTHTSRENDPCAAPYFALHEWGEPNELGGEAWKKAVATPWTERISKLQTAPIYRRIWTVCG